MNCKICAGPTQQLRPPQPSLMGPTLELSTLGGGWAAVAHWHAFGLVLVRWLPLQLKSLSTAPLTRKPSFFSKTVS